MNTLLVTLQLILLLPMLPLALLSQRTSRAQRVRHQGFMTVAVGAGVLALLFVLLSLPDLVGEEPIDLVLTFAPPGVTLMLSALVVRRGLSRSPRSRSGQQTRR